MSTPNNLIPFNDPSDQRPAFDRLLDDANFDAQGNFIKQPPAEGEPGTDAPPDPNAAKAASAAENTAADLPSPDATTEPKPADVAPEKKTEPAAAAKPAEGDGKAATTDQTTAPTDEESEEAIKARLSKPGDKTGEEWRMRYYREGERLHKKLAPVQAQLDIIGSPDRATRGLEFVAALGALETPIAEAATKLTELSASRAEELRNHFLYETVDHFPDAVATELMGEEVTHAELKEALALKRSGATTAKDAQPQSVGITLDATGQPVKPAWFTDDEWADFKVDYEEAFKRMKEQAAKPAPAAAAPDATAKADPPADPKVQQLTTEIEQLRAAQKQRETEEFVAEVDRKGREIHDEAYSIVDERLRELGLTPDTAKDDDTTVKLKQKTTNDIRAQLEAEFEGPNGPGGWEDWSLCTEEQKANRKLEAQIITLLAKKDYRAAQDLLDPLKARIDLTLDRVVEANMRMYNAAMVQPTETTRNAGNGHQRPEIVGGVAASGVQTDEFAKTPWLRPDYRQPGETGEAAFQRYMETHTTLPGR